jgi:pimeloyl-ACP methyl ester carboxylesterase
MVQAMAIVKRLRRMWGGGTKPTREQLQSIEAPTLIIVGDSDIVTTEHAVETFGTLPLRSFVWFRTPVTASCRRRRS